MPYYGFFFQAKDGIRAGRVTGVQTCALPILAGRRDGEASRQRAPQDELGAALRTHRSEERRVGKEERSECGPNHHDIQPNAAFLKFGYEPQYLESLRKPKLPTA